MRISGTDKYIHRHLAIIQFSIGRFVSCLWGWFKYGSFRKALVSCSFSHNLSWWQESWEESEIDRKWSSDRGEGAGGGGRGRGVLPLGMLSFMTTAASRAVPECSQHSPSVVPPTVLSLLTLLQTPHSFQEPAPLPDMTGLIRVNSGISQCAVGRCLKCQPQLQPFP